MTARDVPISIVVPAHNEAARLPPTIAGLRRVLDSSFPAGEIILVDDGSTDRTRALIEEAVADDARLIAVARSRNGGKGAAVRDGVARARGAVILFLDADLAYPVEAIASAAFRVGAGADVVLGARDLAPDGGHRGYPLVRRAAAAAWSAIVDAALDLGVGDTQCGFKAFRRDVARPLFAALKVDGFGFDVEILVLARRWGLRVDRMPLAMTGTGSSPASLLRHAPSMLRDVWRVRSAVRRNAYPNRPERAS